MEIQDMYIHTIKIKQRYFSFFILFKIVNEHTIKVFQRSWGNREAILSLPPNTLNITIVIKHYPK